jgi:hypothetical protein
MKKSIFVCSIGISILIILTSLPSVFASQAYIPSEITPEISEQFVKIIKDINGDFPLEWTPGLIIQIFFTIFNLYIDHLITKGWTPGITFAVIYLFLLLVILGLGSNNSS